MNFLIDLIFTMILYGAFPITYAYVRKKKISQKRYWWTCLGVNAGIMLLLHALLSLGQSAAYYIWALVFCYLGTKILDKRGVLDNGAGKQTNSTYTSESNTPNTDTKEIPLQTTNKQEALPNQPATMPKPEFCEEKPIEKGIKEAPDPIFKKDKVRVIESKSEYILQGNSFILLESSTLGKRADGAVTVACSFRSISNQPVRAMLVDFICSDIWREPVQSLEKYQYIDLDAERDVPFGSDIEVVLPDSATRNVEVNIRKVMFADGTLVERDGENYTIPAPVPLEQMFDVPLCEEYKRQTYNNAKYCPVMYRRWHCWQCTCGAINRDDESSCHACGDAFSVLEKAFDKDVLQSGIDVARKQEEEKIALNKRLKEIELKRRREKEQAEAAERARFAEIEKERKKKAIFKLAVTAAIVLGIYVFGWVTLPAIRYSKANNALENGDYEAAYQTFSALGGYRDSQKKAAEIYYSEGETAFEKQDYDLAYKYFSSIHTYKDAAYKAKWAKYKSATKLMEEGSFLSAAEQFGQLEQFEDAAEQAEYCLNEQGYLDAIHYFDNNYLKDAAKKFESLGDYKDSGERSLEAYYLLAKQYIDKGKLLEAYKVLSSDINKDGKSYEDSLDLAKSVGYQYASSCFEVGEYEEAASIFAELENYKDSKTQLSEARYQQGLALMQAGKYNDAEEVFSQLGNYKDSKRQISEAKYQAALAFKEKGQFPEALAIFEELKNYGDSSNQLKETKYAYADSLLQKRQYEKAADAFKELGTFNDSKDKWLSTMYSYVSSHESNNNKTTYEYLKELKTYKYKDSAALYENLYAWEVSIVINDSEDDYSTKKISIGIEKEICCHIILQGGPPDEEVIVKAVGYWPNGGSTTVTWNEKWKRGAGGTAFYWYNTPSRSPSGTFTVRVYIGSEMVGTESVRLTEQLPSALPSPSS